VTKTQSTQTVDSGTIAVLTNLLKLDGVGIGVGLTSILILVFISNTLKKLAKEISPVNIAIVTAKYIKANQDSLEEIDDRIDNLVTKQDRQIEVLAQLEKLMKKSHNTDLEISGQLEQIVDKVTQKIDATTSEIVDKR
jgi:hypothetical protein